MTEKITLSTKYNCFIWFLSILTSWAIEAKIDPDSGGLKRLPVLKEAGVIPLRVEDEGSDTYDIKGAVAHLKTAYSLAFRASNRFKVSGDDLLKDLWDTVAERKKLSEEYELDALSYLSVVPLFDTVILSAQLVDMDLHLLLKESETIDRHKLAHASFAEILKICKDLTFRMLNRLPVDVTITSVQGPYITLGGGLAQGLHEGDKIEIIRSYIKGYHPATGAWNDFKTTHLGYATIMEHSEQTAVAKLTNVEFEESIEISDGIKSANLPSRLYFSQEKSQLIASNPGAMELDKIVKDMPTKTEATKKQPEVESIAAKKEEESKEAEILPVNNSIPQKLSTKKEPFSSDYFKEFQLGLGYSAWSITAPTSLSSKMLIPLNYLALRAQNEWKNNFHYKIEGNIGTGKTSKDGNFTFYKGSGEVFYSDILENNIFKSYELGSKAIFKNLGVSGATFGGYNYLSLEGIFRLKSLLALAQRNLATEIEISYTPLAFGTLGYRARKHSILGMSGFSFKGSIFEKIAINKIEWGTSLIYAMHELKAKSLSSGKLSEIDLQAMARMRF